MEKLYGSDYMRKPYLELVGHPDFSEEAFRIMAVISTMDTNDIVRINLHLLGDSNG